VIESRIKRALWAVSILITLGFGGQFAYEYYLMEVADFSVQEWGAKYNALIKDCADPEPEPGSLRLPCQSSFRGTPEDIKDANHRWAEANRRWNEAAGEAARSLAIAVGAPVALWALFFFVRWIWTGRIRNSQSLAAEKRPLFTKQVLYWGLGILGCAFLFAVNVLVLPSGRAVQVLVSTAVQGIGLVLLVWIVSKVREARQKRSEQKRAAQPVASVDPPQASGH